MIVKGVYLKTKHRLVGILIKMLLCNLFYFEINKYENQGSVL